MIRKELKNAKILVVDDDPINIEIIEEILHCKYNILSVDSGTKALEAAADFHPDVVLLDIMMPDMDGYEVCRRIRSNDQLSLTKIILVSAKPMFEDRMEGYKAGADDYMTKPFNPEELLAKVQVFLRLKSIEEVERIKSDLLSVFSHETKTPLHSILGFAKLLLENQSLSNAEKEALTHIRKNGEEMLKLVDKAILLSHLKDGREQMKLRNILLERLLGMAAERVESELHYGNVSLRMALSPNIVVEVDENLMVTALACLLNKAVKLAEPGSVIEISSKHGHGDKDVAIVVKTEGIPIRESEIPNEYYPFHVDDVAHHGRGSGGLDLSIAGHIIEAHNGEMTLKSEGNTTRFVLNLGAIAVPHTENDTKTGGASV